MFDLHRHDEFSTFDGFGKASELAEYAKELGYKSLGTTNHGNTNGLIRTWQACKELDMKAILGVEGYFLPKYKEQTRGYHLILIAKNLQGYHNLNKIQYEGDLQRYYNPIWDFKMLEKYHEGLICTSACIASYSSKCIIEGREDLAEKYLIKMKSIFGEDFYIEIQPYKVSEKGLQEYVNVQLIKLAKKLKIKCILTSDSHRGKKEDLETYVKMHQIAGHDEDWIRGTYTERYMPTPDEMQNRFYNMHKRDFDSNIECKKFVRSMERAIDEIEDKCELNYLDNLQETLPKMSDDSLGDLKKNVKQGLKDRGKWNKKYWCRALDEIDVIQYHNFQDYFLMVAEYVNWAKDRGIYVGPGRGSGCNYITDYALNITEVDSIYFNLEPRRFLMKERHKMPDIDIDFETDRRGEVIQHLLDTYPGRSAQVCSYGLYRVDNLINDLAKVCGLITDKSVDDIEAKQNKQVIAEIKKLVKLYIDDTTNLDKQGLLNDDAAKSINIKYEDILLHFTKLYNKVRYIGTHAAGVAIVGDDIFDFTALKYDAKSGRCFTAYDLLDLEVLGVVKFDMLGLKTMSEIGECRKHCNVDGFKEYMIEDKKVIDAFSKGNCNGIFQFDKKSVQDLLVQIHCNSFADVIAASAMNRPGPLSQKMPEIYGDNKIAIENGTGEAIIIPELNNYLQDTYGCIVYQEQIMTMAHDIANMNWDDAYKVLKYKYGSTKRTEIEYFNNQYPKYEKQFVIGAKKLGMDEGTAKEIFKKFYNYSFNKGHATGYSLISAEQMFYKVHNPTIFWFSKLKYVDDDAKFAKYCECAVADGSIVFLPHVNCAGAKTSLRKVDGEYIIQQGLSSLKDVGEKAADFICEERKKNGIFVNYDNFYDRCKSRLVTTRVIDKLKEAGALEFNKKIYIKRVTKYNSALYSRAN